MKRPDSHNGGSTLMLALWALILLSAVLFAWIERVDRGIDTIKASNRGLEARAMAHSGLAVGMHPNISLNSPNLVNRFDGGRSYHVEIESEGGRLNINYLLAGADPAKLKFFREYLTLKGLTFQERDRLVDCLLDWTNPETGKRRMNGVPEGPNYHLPHRPLESIEEIALVAGSEPLVARANWKDELTIYSNGPLDLESVSAELLAMIPGISPDRAARFVEMREKRKGAAPDGRPFKDVAEAIKFLGLTQEQFSTISPFLGFRDPVQRIRSVGEAGESVHEVEVVVQKSGGDGQIMLWVED